MSAADSRFGSRGERPACLHNNGLFQTLAGNTDALVLVVNGRGEIVFVNEESSRIAGLDSGELHGTHVLDLFGDDRARVKTTLEADGRDQGRTIEVLLVRPDGKLRALLWTATCLEQDEAGERLHLVHARDLTPQREAELESLESEIRLRALLSGMLDAVVAIDSYGIVRFTSDSVKTIFGWEPSELIGKNVNVLLPEPHHSKHDGYLERYRETGQTWILDTTREFEALHKSGHSFWIELSVSKIEIPDQEPLFCGAFRDVTARRHADQVVQESEKRFRAIFDQEFQMVGLLEASGMVLEINKAAVQMVGAKRSQIRGQMFWDTPWWSHSQAAIDQCRSWVMQAIRGEFVRDEIQVRSATGEIRVMDFSLKPVRDESGEVQFLIPEGRDITELKHAQQRETSMLRALADLGESASLLAHEIKNPITSLNLALRAVASKLGEHEARAVQDLIARLRKLESTLRRTLSFAKPLDLNIERTQVLPLLIEAVEQLRPEAEDREIDILIDGDSSHPDLHVDEELIRDLLCNLVRNSLDVLSSTGEVRVSARRQGPDRIQFAVEDSGPGIPESVRETLFQPFVTTKDGGTGLGLPLARKIAEQHGGRLEVGSSEVLGGARFILELPCTPA